MVMVQSYSLALAAEDGSIGSSILHITDADGLTTDVIDEDLETQEYMSMGVTSWNAVNDEPFDYSGYPSTTTNPPKVINVQFRNLSGDEV